MRISVIGTGYVGLVTGVCLAERGHSVLCVDVDPDKVAMINAAHAPIHEPGLPGLLRRHGQVRCVSRYPEPALVHYLTMGWREGLTPHPLFDGVWYRREYPEILALGAEPLTHFLAEGGDNFPDFAKGTNRLETGLLDLDAFTDYLRASEGQGASLAPEAARIIKVQ